MNKFNAMFRVSFRGMIHSLGFQGSKKKTADRSGWLNFALVMGLNLWVAASYGMSMMMLLKETGNTQVFFAFMALLGVVFCTMFTLTGAKEVVFGTRDIDIVLSLPIHGRVVLLARLAALYCENAAFVLVWLLCAGGIWAVQGNGVSPTLFLVLILSGILLAVLPTLASLLIGVALAAISGRFARHALVENVLYFVGILLFCGFFFGLTKLQTAQSLTIELKGILTPFAWMTEACYGNWLALFKVALICVMPAVAVCLVCGHYYVAILASLTTQHGKSNYKLKQMKAQGVTLGLLKKEWCRYINTPIYVFNTAFGFLIYMASAVAVLVKREMFWELLQQEGFGNVSPLLLLAGFTAFVFAMVAISASSISLEGKSFWVLKSLPISAKQILSAKVLFHWLACAPFVVVGGILLGVGVGVDALSLCVFLLWALFYVWSLAQIGLLINLKFPKLDAVNDTVVVKQSAATGLSIWANVIFVLLLGGIAVFLNRYLPLLLSALCSVGVLVVVVIGLTMLLQTQGVRMLENLEP